MLPNLCGHTGSRGAAHARRPRLGADPTQSVVVGSLGGRLLFALGTPWAASHFSFYRTYVAEARPQAESESLD
jgi:hypothetical protein